MEILYLPSFHFFGGPIPEPPWHVGRAQDQAEYESKEHGHKHSQRQGNKTRFLRLCNERREDSLIIALNLYDFLV